MFAGYRARRNFRRALSILDNPTAYRVMRPGWENVNFTPDPTRPGVALAYGCPRDVVPPLA